MKPRSRSARAIVLFILFAFILSALLPVLAFARPPQGFEGVPGTFGLGMGATLMAFCSTRMFGRRCRRQLAALDQATGRLAAGDLSARVPVDGRDAAGVLARSFNQMAEELEADRVRVLEQKRQIEAASRSYLELLGFVSHEMRSTLGAALFNVELLCEGSYGELSPDQRQGVEIVAVNLHHLHEILDNYLQLSRIEKGELTPRLTEVALRRDVIAPAVDRLEGCFKAREMRLEVRVPGDIEVVADVSLLRAVYENLLSNAFKYGRQGGRVVLEADDQGANVRLGVWNEGRGIPSDRLDTVFRKFDRHDGVEPTGKRGSGLGLFIVEQIVRQHGGEVAVESREGEWARFSVTVPRADPMRRPAAMIGA